MEKMKILLYITVFSCFFSITVFEGFIILLLLVGSILILAKKEIFKGYFLLPISLYAVPTLISNILFNIKAIQKALEQSVFSYIYLVVPFFNLNYKDLERINKIIMLAGYISLGYLVYNYYKNDEFLFVRGTAFELAMFSSIFAIVSFSLYMYTKNKIYIVLFAIFSLIVFASARRSYMIGFSLAFFLLLFIFKKQISHRIIYAFVSFLILLGISSFYIYKDRDPRFKYFYEFVKGKRELDRKVFNVIVSTRGYRFERSIKKISQSWKEGNYVAFIIGHGIENPKRYLPPRYESTFFISEFIERGIIGLAGILLFFYRYFKFFFKFSIRTKEDILLVPFLVIPSINIGASIFNVFWNATLPLYVLFLGIVEYFYYKNGHGKMQSDKHS